MVSRWGTIYGNSLDFLYTVFTQLWSRGQEHTKANSQALRIGERYVSKESGTGYT